MIQLYIIQTIQLYITNGIYIKIIYLYTIYNIIIISTRITRIHIKTQHITNYDIFSNS